jgi:hypothetical protein
MRLAIYDGPSKVGVCPFHLSTERDTVSETSCLLISGIRWDGQSSKKLVILSYRVVPSLRTERHMERTEKVQCSCCNFLSLWILPLECYEEATAVSWVAESGCSWNEYQWRIAGSRKVAREGRWGCRKRHWKGRKNWCAGKGLERSGVGRLPMWYFYIETQFKGEEKDR